MTVSPPVISTGIAGLDEILQGGLPQNHIYLVEGAYGSGKTTLGLQFLLEGVRRGENALYLSLLQAREDIMETALSHGWDLTGIEIATLNAPAAAEARMAGQTLLPRDEVHLNEVLDAIERKITEYRPARLYFDSISELHLLSADHLVFRQKFLMLKNMLDELKVTTLVGAAYLQESGFKTLINGVIQLDFTVPSFGEIRRRIMVEKLRSSRYKTGFHDLRILTGGLEVYPRLPSAGRKARQEIRRIESGNSSLDRMLYGGLEEGTSCAINGESGTGKSLIGAQYAHRIANSGDYVHILLWDQEVTDYLQAAAALALDLRPFLESGNLSLQKINLDEMTTGELAHTLRLSVERHDCRMVVFDSLTGYFNTMAEEPRPTARLFEMVTYLRQNRVLVLLMRNERNPFTPLPGEIDIGYLADSMIQLRRFEAWGSVRLAISVLKKRLGSHEKGIHELLITSEGITIGEQLKDFNNILSGNPEYRGREEQLLK